MKYNLIIKRGRKQVIKGTASVKVKKTKPSEITCYEAEFNTRWSPYDFSADEKPVCILKDKKTNEERYRFTNLQIVDNQITKYRGTIVETVTLNGDICIEN